MMQSQPCACPIPLSHLLRMMDAPPVFTPPKESVRRPNPIATESRRYSARKEAKKPQISKHDNSQSIAKYLAGMSKTMWRNSIEIADIIGVSNVSVTKALARAYIKPFIERKKQKCMGGIRFIWRIK